MAAYLNWLIIFVIVPLLALWIIDFKILIKYKLAVLFAVVGSVLWVGSWDIKAVKQGIWYFNDASLVGIWYKGLPLEEWLFMVFVAALFATITILLWKKYGVRK